MFMFLAELIRVYERNQWEYKNSLEIVKSEKPCR